MVDNSDSVIKPEKYMALTKDKKQAVIAEVGDLLSTSKMTVVAKYQGTTVKEIQDLRRKAQANGTKVRVVKNRLVKKAIELNPNLKDVDTTAFEGMLLYAFNSDDEVAPAQSLNEFAKLNPTLQFVAAISGDGKLLSADEVKALADLPSKNQLIAQVVAQLLSPVNDITNALSGNLHALLEGIEAKASN